MLKVLRLPLLVALTLALLVLSVSLTLTTCHTTQPGEMSRAQTRATQADVRRQDAAAQLDSARSASASFHSDQLYQRGQAYQDSATHPSANETTVIPSPDSSRVQRFLSDLFSAR